jgi:hypothetical protein
MEGVRTRSVAGDSQKNISEGSEMHAERNSIQEGEHSYSPGSNRYPTQGSVSM